MAKSQQDYEEEARRQAFKDLIGEALDEKFPELLSKHVPGVMEDWLKARQSTRTGGKDGGGKEGGEVEGGDGQQKRKGGFFDSFGGLFS